MHSKFELYLTARECPLNIDLRTFCIRTNSIIRLRVNLTLLYTAFLPLVLDMTLSVNASSSEAGTRLLGLFVHYRLQN